MIHSLLLFDFLQIYSYFQISNALFHFFFKLVLSQLSNLHIFLTLHHISLSIFFSFHFVDYVVNSNNNIIYNNIFELRYSSQELKFLVTSEE